VFVSIQIPRYESAFVPFLFSFCFVLFFFCFFFGGGGGFLLNRLYGFNYRVRFGILYFSCVGFCFPRGSPYSDIMLWLKLPRWGWRGFGNLVAKIRFIPIHLSTVITAVHKLEAIRPCEKMSTVVLREMGV